MTLPRVLSAPPTSRGLVSTLAWTLLLPFLLNLLHEDLHAEDRTPSLVGKKLPYLNTGRWYGGTPLNVGSLRGQKWVLVLATLGKPQFDTLLPLLESTHRPLSDGGPVVIIYTKQPHKEIQEALRDMPRKPKIPLVSDRRHMTHLKLKVSVFPYIFIIDETNRVSWQGPAQPGIDTRLTELRDSVREKNPGKTGGDDPQKRAPLPDDYGKQVRRALDRKDTEEQIRLLKLAHLGSSPPTQGPPIKLWRRLSADLDRVRRRIEKEIETDRLSSARKKLAGARTQFAGFPPVSSLDSPYQRLARLEGGAWLEKAKAELESGDRQGARKTLQDIVAHYGDTDVGREAQQLLDTPES